MAFGKMGSNGPHEPRLPRQSVPDQKPASIPDEESPVWPIWGALCGTGLLIVLATYWALTNQYDQVAAQTAEARSVAGRYDFSHAFALTGVPAATLERNITLRSACTSQLNQMVKTRRSEPPAHTVDPNSGALKYNYAAAGEALNCLLLNEQSRLCEAGERKKLVNEINRYIDKLHVERRNAEHTNSNPIARNFALVRERMEAMDEDSEPASGDITSNAVTASVSTRLVEAIEWASNDGYLSAADFGGSMPAELAAHFNKPRKTPCKG